jgi:hypothetical protein
MITPEIGFSSNSFHVSFIHLTLQSTEGVKVSVSACFGKKALESTTMEEDIH